jgi:hypothetical protein
MKDEAGPRQQRGKIEKTLNKGVTIEEENQWHYGAGPRQEVTKTENCNNTSTCSWKSCWIDP